MKTLRPCNISIPFNLNITSGSMKLGHLTGELPATVALAVVAGANKLALPSPTGEPPLYGGLRVKSSHVKAEGPFREVEGLSIPSIVKVDLEVV